jgi:hypothetical protein
VRGALSTITGGRQAADRLEIGPRCPGGGPYPDLVKQVPGTGVEAEPSSGGGAIGLAIGPGSSRLTLELVETAMAGAADLGRKARLVRPGDDQSGLEVLLGVGFPGSFMSVFAAPACCRRVVWVGEALLARDEPAASPVAWLARSRAMDYLRFPLRPFKQTSLPGPLARARADAATERVRAVTQRQVGMLARRVDRIVVTSRDRQAVMLSRGLRAAVAPYGYAAAVAGPITPPDWGQRDLAIVSLAGRHARATDRGWVLESWQAAEPRLRLLEDVWGAERGELLRRSRVMLNVSRTPGNFVGVRLVLALAAGAVVVSEPMTDPYPFAAGIHFVEAPLPDLLEAARDLEADEPRRRAMVVAGQALLCGELAAARCLARAIGSGD